mmetsp:Transcript_17163/g.66818  ORF Transcript_17163/g.66818 Transcript_17163/m.66818 type:complete len:225 (-) Transcript_17163:652-1326(-)
MMLTMALPGSSRPSRLYSSSCETEGMERESWRAFVGGLLADLAAAAAPSPPPTTEAGSSPRLFFFFTLFLLEVELDVEFLSPLGEVTDFLAPDFFMRFLGLSNAFVVLSLPGFSSSLPVLDLRIPEESPPLSLSTVSASSDAVSSLSSLSASRTMSSPPVSFSFLIGSPVVCERILPFECTAAGIVCESPFVMRAFGFASTPLRACSPARTSCENLLVMRAPSL